MNDATKGHWLTFAENRDIVGCFCGFTVSEDDDGWGDSVVKHLLAVGWEEGHAAPRRGDLCGNPECCPSDLSLGNPYKEKADD
jgi:hypothetical protein